MLSELINAFRGGSVDFGSILMQLFALLLIIFLVLPFHEWAHAFTALKLGDTSVKYRGRLSLNPLAHIDVLGSIFLLCFGFGWAKPVPVDSRNFKNEKVGMAITAVMGPVANLVAGLVGQIIFYALLVINPNFFLASQVGLYISMFLNYYVTVNIYLAVFNLIPIPPLDGSKILFVFLPDKAVNFFYQYERYIMIILFALLWMGFLSTPLVYLSDFVYDGINFVARLPFLWAF
ncbi:MAG: site-2 protease family protein [Oscillospiraceae bacterium]|nr:site-2 protease family protein [Oscillospiraceae bacterium]